MDTKKKATTTADKPSNLYRALSGVFLINSAAFAQVVPNTQTSTLALAAGKPVKFVPDFAALSDKRVIRDGLLSGKDVLMELEFNGVTLDEAELAALRAIKPILTKINAIGPNYTWLKQSADGFPGITFEDNKVRRNGHYIPKAAAKRVWNKASAYWAGGKAPRSNEVPADGSYYSNKIVTYDKDNIRIGCQTISRAEVEFIARHFGFEPNLSVV